MLFKMKLVNKHLIPFFDSLDTFLSRQRKVILKPCLKSNLHDFSLTVNVICYDLVNVVIFGKEMLTPNDTSSESISF